MKLNNLRTDISRINLVNIMGGMILVGHLT